MPRKQHYGGDALSGAKTTQKLEKNRINYKKTQRRKTTKWQPKLITFSPNEIANSQKEKLMTELGSLINQLLNTNEGAL